MIADLMLRCHECNKFHEKPYKYLDIDNKKIYFHSKKCLDLYKERNMGPIINQFKKIDIENTEKEFMTIMFDLHS